MAKPDRQSKPRADRGKRYCMVLELERDDHEKLEKLVVRFSKQLGPDVKSNKALVLRKLIRYASAAKTLPQEP